MAKIVLTNNGNTYTYGVDTANRLKDIKHSEEPYRQAAQVVIDNSDNTLTTLNLWGYKGVISYGYKDPIQGDEYSACAPLWVVGMKVDSLGGRIIVTLSLAGISNLLNEDRASDDFTPDSNDAKTVKDLLKEIANGGFSAWQASTAYSVGDFVKATSSNGKVFKCTSAGTSDSSEPTWDTDVGDTTTDNTVTWTCRGAEMTCYTHCKAYTITFDSEDSLIDVYAPTDSFRIYLNGTRLASMKRLLRFTKCVMRIEDDGEIHIQDPTISGSSYDYEYNDAHPITNHNFYDKSVRKRIVIPGYIEVSSHPEHEDSYTGFAKDTDYDTYPDEMKIRKHLRLRVSSNQQCTDIATAKLQHHQVEAERGHGFAPMNVGQEVYDYVNITDSRTGDTRAGNILYMNSHYTPGKFEFEFRFGAPLLTGLAGTTPPQLSTAGVVDWTEAFDALWDAFRDLQDWIKDTLIPSISATMQEIKDEVLALEERLNGLGGPMSWVTLFDGSVDTPTTVDWGYEDNLPFTPTGQLYFSPVIEEAVNAFVIYVIDQGTNFWKYYIKHKSWVQLASPTYSATGAHRHLVPNDMTNPVELWCCSETDSDVANTQGEGIRISQYVIATDTWAEGARTPRFTVQINHGSVSGGPFVIGETITGGTSGATADCFSVDVPGTNIVVVPLGTPVFQGGETITGGTSLATASIDGGGEGFGSSPYWRNGDWYYGILAIVYVSATEIWCWGAEGSESASTRNVRCIKYNPTANSWAVASRTKFTNQRWGISCAAINAAGTVVYGGGGEAENKYEKYTIASDTYAASSAKTGFKYAFAYDEDKLPYTRNSNLRQGYIDTDDDSSNNDQFAENTDRSAGYGRYFGISDDWAYIVALARSTAPELMSVVAGGTYLLGTIYSNGLTPVLVQKPTDNYTVFIVNTVTAVALRTDETAILMLPEGTWQVLYPVNGDYTQLLIMYGVS